MNIKPLATNRFQFGNEQFQYEIQFDVDGVFSIHREHGFKMCKAIQGNTFGRVYPAEHEMLKPKKKVNL